MAETIIFLISVVMTVALIIGGAVLYLRLSKE